MVAYSRIPGRVYVEGLVDCDFSQMTSLQRIRRNQILTQAEGYLELGLPRCALEILDSYDGRQSLDGRGLYLKGEALRSLDQHAEAIDCFVEASDSLPDDMHIRLAMGWCYKRMGRLQEAIGSLQAALALEPQEAILHYNLACYFSLDGNKRRALTHLSRALEIDGDFRDMIHDESDFDPVRNDPDFQRLTSIVV